MIKLDSKLGIRTPRGRPVWADHRWNDHGLPLFPEGVLTEDEVGEVERQTRGLPDPHLKPRGQRERQLSGDITASRGQREEKKNTTIYPAGEPPGHVHHLPVGVHHLVAAALAGVLGRVVSSAEPLRYGAADPRQLDVQPARDLCTSAILNGRSGVAALLV